MSRSCSQYTLKYGRVWRRVWQAVLLVSPYSPSFRQQRRNCAKRRPRPGFWETNESPLVRSSCPAKSSRRSSVHQYRHEMPARIVASRKSSSSPCVCARHYSAAEWIKRLVARLQISLVRHCTQQLQIWEPECLIRGVGHGNCGHQRATSTARRLPSSRCRTSSAYV
jgi:hypothetical protein